MTLTLDDVRNKRFRMARKSGYEVLEVDEFVDEVEESFAQLIEENQNLKKQVDSLRSAPPAPPQAAAAAPQGAQTGPDRVDDAGPCFHRTGHRGQHPDADQPEHLPPLTLGDDVCREIKLGTVVRMGAQARRTSSADYSR